jgi:hypothetical protein
MPSNYTLKATIICRTCGIAKLVRPYLAQRAMYCSRKCVNADPTRTRSQRPHLRKPLSERLWSRVERTDTCWVWQGVRADH